jgi:hypothetical protein
VLLDDEGIIIQICYSMDIWKSFASPHPYRQSNIFPLAKLLCIVYKIFYMHLSRGSFILYWVLIASIFLKLFSYMLLEFIFESSLYLVYLVGQNLLISLLCVVINFWKRGDWSIYALICVLVINDDPYFWNNKFIEIIIVLVETRKKISWRCCLWMTQGKGIVIGLSILPVKVISGEMTELLE